MPPRAVGWSLLWLAVAAVVVLPYVHSYRHLSPFDELVHVDYVVKAQHFELVNGGERVGQTAMREQACRGHDIASMEFPPCRTPRFDPEEFPEKGFNTAYPDPPLYYALTAVGASVVELVPGVDSVVTAARSLGVLWLGLGLGLTFLLSLRLGARPWPAAGATLLMASAPALAHAAATVTSDAALLPAGALLLLVAVGVAEGRVRWWWLLPAAAVAGLVKATSLTVLGVVVLYLLLQLLPDRSRRSAADPSATSEEDDGRSAEGESGAAPRVPAGSVLLGASAVALAGVAALGAWAVLTSATAFASVNDIPMREAYKVPGLDWDTQIGPNVFALMTPLQIGYLPPFMTSFDLALVMGLVNTLLIAAVAAVSWFGRTGAQATRLAFATLAGMLLSGPALVLVVYVGSHTYLPIPPRYGLSLVPAIAACLAVAASRRRAGGPVLTVLGLVGMAALLVQTL